MAHRTHLGFLLLFAAGCGGSRSPICDASGLTSALGSARSGDTVHVGACTIMGSFSVSQGITLEGLGTTSRLVGPADQAAITLQPGARIEDVQIESGGKIGVLARGAS